MKNLAVLLFLLLPVFCISQTNMETNSTDLYIKVYDVNEEVVPFYSIQIRQATSGATQNSTTDIRGTVWFKVTTGNNYQVIVDDTISIATITIPTNSLSFVNQKVTVPRLASDQKQAIGKIDTIDQNSGMPVKPDQDKIFLKIGLTDHLNQPVKNKTIRIFNGVTRKTYVCKTNSYGFAQFHVPGRTEYSVGIDRFENFDVISAPHHSLGVVLTFVPTKVKETETNDTIIQEAGTQMRNTTERVLIKIYLRNRENQPLVGEDVYFNQQETSKVYTGKTGPDGVLTMMLPKGHTYMLNFKYERSMKRYDFPMSPLLYSTSLQINYIGSKKVEEFYRTAQRDGDFRTEFMEGKVTKMQLDPQVVEKTARGFNLNFPDNGPVLTPAVINNNLYVSSGYHSPDIYCLNAETGASKWGIRLAENGPSVLVIDKGMLLINTESCTLYAIDIETGILAWSKWLGPIISHSPAVANGKVYAAYPDDLHYSGTNYVLAAFDIKTGAIVWQNRIGNEPLSAPVVYENKLFITDANGWLYHFDAENGSRLAFFDAKATAAGVFDGKSLWVTLQSQTNPALSHLAQLNPTNLLVLNNLAEISDSVNNLGVNYLSAAERMSYSRSRIIIDKDICYQNNRNGIQAISCLTGKILWTTPTKNNLIYNSILTFAGKYLLTSVNNAKIGLINPINGQIVKEFYTTEMLSSEPVVAKGWIYCGTKNGKLVAINTKDKTLDGWGQWGMNATHNPYRE